MIKIHLSGISIYRSELMGWAILWIMMIHFTFTQIKPLGFISQYVFARVDIFMLVFGFGLYFSIDKDSYFPHYVIERMYFDARLGSTKLCPTEDAQTKVDGGRVKGKYFTFYPNIFVESLSSRNFYRMVGRLFENTRLSSFDDLCEIASRYVHAKAKMIGFVGVRRNFIGQLVTKTVTVAQLPEHHDEHLVPASEMLHEFVSFVFHYISIKDSLWQELYELSEDLFSDFHRMTDLFLGCKDSQFKSSSSFIRTKTLYLNNLQTSPLFFSGH